VKGNSGTTPGQNFIARSIPNRSSCALMDSGRSGWSRPAPARISSVGLENYADAGVIGSTISGGGAADAPNRIAIGSSAVNCPRPSSPRLEAVSAT